MNYIVSVLRLLAIVFGFEILFILMLASGPSLLAESNLEDPLATVNHWLSPDTQDTPLRPTPSPLVSQPSLLATESHMESEIYGLSQYENTIPYHVVDQCLCPPETMVTKAIFKNNEPEDDFSFSDSFVFRSGSIH